MAKKVYIVGKRRGFEVPPKLGRERRVIPVGKPVTLDEKDARVLQDAAWDVKELTQELVDKRKAELQKEIDSLTAGALAETVAAENAIADLEGEPADPTEDPEPAADPAAAAAWKTGDYQKRRKFAIGVDPDAFENGKPKGEELKAWYEERLGVELGE
jgi:hypothetical protein